MNISNLQASEILLKVFTHRIQSHIAQEMLDDYPIQIDVRDDRRDPFDRIIRGMVLSLKMKTVGQSLDRLNVKYPNDWKEAVKERFAPKWLLRRYPVKYHKVTIEPLALYPQLKIPTNHMAPIFSYHILRQEDE